MGEMSRSGWRVVDGGPFLGVHPAGHCPDGWTTPFELAGSTADVGSLSAEQAQLKVGRVPKAPLPRTGFGLDPNASYYEARWTGRTRGDGRTHPIRPAEWPEACPLAVCPSFTLT